MSKVLKVVALSALVVGAGVLTFGAGGAAVAGLLGVSSAVGGAISATVAGISASLGMSGLQRAFAGRPASISSLSDLERLNLTSVAAAPRKAVFGPTAFASDLRYTEPSGTDQRFIDAIVHLASHKSEGVQEIRIGDKVAWINGSGVQGIFVGYLTVDIILESGAADYHTVNGGANWGADQRLTGCTTMHLRFDRQGATAKAASPFAAGIPSQIVTVGAGMPVYDPRRDSTVPGGSGAHRADNCDTWEYLDGLDVLGENPALQALAWLLGWRIMGEVSVGLGLPPARLNLPQFAAAANICEEDIALVVGGAQKRYAGGGLFADNAPPLDVMAAFAASVCGWWDDSGGQLGLFPAVNDLAGPLVEIGDDDILGAVEWTPFPDISALYNVCRGTNPDPDMPANFQPTDYPEVRIASDDGIDRVLPISFAMVQDKARAQRLAKQALQRQQYRGIAKLMIGLRGWQLERSQPIRLSFGGLGWASKLFRVETWSPQLDGSVILELREENPAIYAWEEDEAAAVVPATPVTYNPGNNPFLITAGSQIGVDDNATRNTPRGTYTGSDTYVRGDQVVEAGSTYQLIVDSSTGNAPPDASRWILVAAAGSGEPGINGSDGYGVIISNEAHVVATLADGTGGSYSAAGGTMRVFRGITLLSPTYSIPAKTPTGSWISIDSAGTYSVSDAGVDLATATLRADVAGILFDRTYTLAKSKQGLQGPTLRLTADNQGFTYLDGTALPTSQSITLFAALSGISGTIVWTSSPAVTLTGSGASRSLAVADFGTNRQVTVTATLGSYSDRITLVRLDRSSADSADNLIRNPGMALNADSWNLGPTWSRDNTFGPPGWGIYTDSTRPSGSAGLNSNQDTPIGSATKLYLSSWALRAGTSPAGHLALMLYFKDADGADTGYAGLTLSVSTPGVWQRLQAAVTVPAGSATFRAYYESAVSSGYAYVGAPRVASTQLAADVTGENTANNTANVGSATAAVLVADAATAKADAASALSTLSVIASDSYLSRGEKSAVVAEWQAIDGEYAGIVSRAATLALSGHSLYSSWTAARSALDSYLSGLSPAWNSLTTDTPISGSTFRTAFVNYYNARQALLDLFVATAQATADLKTRNVDRGPWSALATDTAFVVGDEVQDQSSTWGCIAAHTKTGVNGPPALPTTVNTNWRLRAKVGDTGGAGQSIARIFIRATSRPTTPADSAGTPSGWYVDPEDVPAGAGMIWASTGTRAVAATNYVWGGAVRDEALTVISGQQVVPITRVGASAWITLALAGGETASVEAQWWASWSGGASADLELEWRELGGSTITTFGSSDGPQAGNVGEPTLLAAGGTLTNGTGAGRQYQIRGVAVKTGAGAATTDTADSYVRA